MLTDSEAALARAVLIHGPISRSALTHRLGLSPASLTRLAKPFLDRGHPGRTRRRRRRLGGSSDQTAGHRAGLRPVRRRQAHRRPAVRRCHRHPGLSALRSRESELQSTDPQAVAESHRRDGPRARRRGARPVSGSASAAACATESSSRPPSSDGAMSTSLGALAAARRRRHRGERPRRARRGRALVRSRPRHRRASR